MQTGLTTLIWAGDADWICNWLGGLAAANAIQYPGSSAFAAAALRPYTVAGAQGGTFKSVGNLSFLRVFDAGHEVPFYRMYLLFFVFGCGEGGADAGKGGRFRGKGMDA